MTAVEWLQDKLNKKYGNNDFVITHNNEFNKAKEMERQQNKIILTDEEIEKAAKEYDIQSTRYGAGGIFIDACKWYREQLKLKQ